MLRARSRMLSFRPAQWVVSQVAEGPADLGEAFGGLAPAPDWLSQARGHEIGRGGTGDPDTPGQRFRAGQ
jgi:hypothetical protein